SFAATPLSAPSPASHSFEVAVSVRKDTAEIDTKQEKNIPDTQLDEIPVLEADPVAASSPAELLGEAQEAFASGNYARVIELTRSLRDDAAGAALHVRALANLETVDAERACAEAASRH